MSFPANQLRAIFGFIESLHAAQSFPEFHQTLITGMGQFVPGECFDLAVFGDQTEPTEGFVASSGAFTSAEIAFQLENAFEHPLARCFSSGNSGAFSISQLATDREWQNTSVFAEGGYGRLGLRYELAIDIPGISHQMLASFSVVRSTRDFSQNDRETLKLLRPHITRAWQQLRHRSQKNSPNLLQSLYPALSAREAEILHWIVEGKQNGEIATILQRRLSTIQEHVENILHKLRLENRHQLTVTVLRAISR